MFPRLLVSCDPKPFIDIIIKKLEPSWATYPSGVDCVVVAAKTVAKTGTAVDTACDDNKADICLTTIAEAGAAVNHNKR
jgi:hypothetical protein